MDLKYDVGNQNRKLYLCEINNYTMSEERINTLEKRIDSIESKLDLLIKTMTAFVSIVNENFSEVKEKIDNLETKINSLDVNTDKNFKDVKWELKKIQDVTQYADIHANFPPAKA